MILTMENLSTQQKTFPSVIFLPHIPCGVAWNQTQNSTVRGQSLAAWAISWPNTKLLYLISRTMNFSHTQLIAVLYNILSWFLLWIDLLKFKSRRNLCFFTKVLNSLNNSTLILNMAFTHLMWQFLLYIPAEVSSNYVQWMMF